MLFEGYIRQDSLNTVVVSETSDWNSLLYFSFATSSFLDIFFSKKSIYIYIEINIKHIYFNKKNNLCCILFIIIVACKSLHNFISYYMKKMLKINLSYNYSLST